jgi:hypothetical protein
MRKPGCRFAWIAALLLPALGLPAASAHPTQFTTLQVVIDPTGQFRASLNIDILSYAMGQTSLQTTNEELETLLDGPRAALGRDLADAGERFRREVVIHTDVGDVTPSSWNLPGLPELDAVLARNIHPRILVPGEIDFSGTVPAAAHTISIRLPYVLGDTVQIYELPNGDSHDEPVTAGDYSSTIALNLSIPARTSRPADFVRYLAAGFAHMLWRGPEHAFFVLGIFLFGARFAPLLWQVLTFAIAHSITLALCTYGVLQVPEHLTAVLVAASVICLATANLFENTLKLWRLLAIFAFGLIHGFGFAHAFVRIAPPHDDLLIGLTGFNLGLECGQVAVLVVAFLAVGRFRQRSWYRRVIIVPASMFIALISAFGMLHRISGG